MIRKKKEVNLYLFFTDFDLCYHCFGFVQENHPPNHTFIAHLMNNNNNETKNPKKMPQNIKKSSTSVVHHSHVICDHCDTEIKGIRYKASLIYLLFFFFFDKLNFVFEISAVTAVIMIYVRNVRRYHQRFTMNNMYS